MASATASGRCGPTAIGLLLANSSRRSRPVLWPGALPSPEARTIQGYQLRSLPPVMVSTFFRLATLTHEMLTYHGQSRSNTGETTRAGPPLARSTWWALDLVHLSIVSLTPSCDRMCAHQTGPVLDLLELDRTCRSGSDRMRHPVLVKMSIGARRQNRRPWYLHRYHMLAPQPHNPPGGYPRQWPTPTQTEVLQKNKRSW